jgi:ribosome biogenesis protein Nip4
MKEDFKINKLILPKHFIIRNNMLFEVSEKLKNYNFKIKSLKGGLLLSNKNKPTQRLLELNKKRIKNYIILNDKSSFLFTCGRRVLKKGMVERKGRGPYYLAMNENGEVLGIVKYSDNKYNNLVNIGVYHKQDSLKRILF